MMIIIIMVVVVVVVLVVMVSGCPLNSAGMYTHMDTPIGVWEAVQKQEIKKY